MRFRALSNSITDRRLPAIESNGAYSAEQCTFCAFDVFAGRRPVMHKIDVAIHDNIVEVGIAGKLEKEHYDLFLPQLERLIKERGTIRLLVHMEDFEGWSAGAMWEDIKFDYKHFRDIERLALVGDSQWKRAIELFCKPFTSATTRYFDTADAEEAKRGIYKKSA